MNYNPEGAAYVQDRWEFEGLVLNAGLRFDLFSPGDADRRRRTCTSGQRYKQQFSPRLGIAYPVSDRDVLSFHYGWTYQTPARSFIFENRGISSTVARARATRTSSPETNIAYQAGVQHLFSRDISGQFSVFFKDIYGLITVRQERDEVGNLVERLLSTATTPRRAASRPASSKSFSHKFSADVNYTYSIATGVASDPNQALQFFNGGRLYLPISRAAAQLGPAQHGEPQRDHPRSRQVGIPHAVDVRLGLPVHARVPQRPPPGSRAQQLAPAAVAGAPDVDGDKYYKVWGQNVTLFVDARNVLDAKNISSSDREHGAATRSSTPPATTTTIYYTETGRAGGAYLQDTNGDSILDWVPGARSARLRGRPERAHGRQRHVLDRTHRGSRGA